MPCGAQTHHGGLVTSAVKGHRQLAGDPFYYKAVAGIPVYRAGLKLSQEVGGEVDFVSECNSVLYIYLLWQFTLRPLT
jgi:hypothetical protein